MSQTRKSIVAPYSFTDKVKILKASANARDFVISLYGFEAFSPLRVLALNNQLNVISAEWLNNALGMGVRRVSKPSITEESAFDEMLSVKYDLRDLTITVQMDESGFILNSRDPYCRWIIQGNAKLFKRLIGAHVDQRLIHILEKAYQLELEEAQYVAMSRICAAMHQTICVKPQAGESVEKVA
jgi:hypothetical protein